MNFDVFIKNGRIVNGTGNPWFKADLGIKDGKIVKIGKLPTNHAERIIDAKNLIVTPGFIDMHAHDDLIFLKIP